MNTTNADATSSVQPGSPPPMTPSPISPMVAPHSPPVLHLDTTYVRVASIANAFGKRETLSNVLQALEPAAAVEVVETEKAHAQIAALSGALAKAADRAETLSNVLHNLGYTERGRKVAMATVYEGATRVAASSIAVGPPCAPPPGRLEIPVKQSAHYALGMSAYRAFLPCDRVLQLSTAHHLSFEPTAADVRAAITNMSWVVEHMRDGTTSPPGLPGELWCEMFHGATRTLYYALSWLKLRRDVESVARVSERCFMALFENTIRYMVITVEDLCAFADEVPAIGSHPTARGDLERLWKAVRALDGHRPARGRRPGHREEL